MWIVRLQNKYGNTFLLQLSVKTSSEAFLFFIFCSLQSMFLLVKNPMNNLQHCIILIVILDNQWH